MVCRLEGLRDIFQNGDPDTFYDASCEVEESLFGPLPRGPLHFIWQVERGNPMPARGAELLVFLKPLRQKAAEAPELSWIAIERGSSAIRKRYATR